MQNSSPNKNDLSAKVLRAFTGVMIIIVIIRKWDPQESPKHSHNCIINGTPSEEETHGGSYLRGKFRKDAEYRRHSL